MRRHKKLQRFLLAFGVALNILFLVPVPSVDAQAGCGGTAGPPTPGTVCPDGSTPAKDPSLPWGCPGSSNQNVASPPYDINCPERPGRDACTIKGDELKCVTADNRDVTRGNANATQVDDESTEMACEGGSGLGTALSWVLCPIAHLIVDATDFIQRNIIVPFLTVSPLTTDDGNAVYILWQSIRNIANVMFIIAFFVVIFSQATSIGLSNYGIKRLLPRLAFVAIGTNLSYFIVAFIIDAFNVFGAGISQLVLAAIPPDPTGTDTSAPAGIGIFYGVAGLGLLFTPAAGAVLQWLFSLIGIAFIILLVAVVVLILRQMIILILVIISPLAFVAYLLPNTERYFNKWRNMLIQLLMMYPLIVLLFATGKIVAALINSGNFTLASGETSGAIADAIKVVMAFFASTIPLVALPATFAFAGGIMGKLYGRIRQPVEGASRAGAGKAGEFLKPRAQAMQQRVASYGANRSRWNPARWASYKAGYGARKEFKDQQRERELGRAREEYMAGVAEGSERFRKSASGIGGEAGADRVLAGAYAVREKREKEELENSNALLNQRLRTMNMSDKEYIKKLDEYLKDPSRGTFQYDQRDAQGNTVRETFDFAQNAGLMQASLNMAARQGEIGVLEHARMAGTDTTVNQQQLDTVMRVNEGTIKSKGGYHLATNFNLANAPGRQLAGQSKDAQELEMAKARLADTLAGSSAEDIAGAKQGWLYGVANSLNTSQAPGLAPIRQAGQTDAEFNQLRDQHNAEVERYNNAVALKAWLNEPDQAEKRDAIMARLAQIRDTPNVRAKAPREAINQIYGNLTGTDPTTNPFIPGSQTPPSP